MKGLGILLLLIGLLPWARLQAEEKEHGHEEETRRNVGPDKAVLEADEHVGFRLRDGVEERLGIKTQALSSTKEMRLGKAALVFSREEYQVFRKRSGFWRAIDVKAERKGAYFLVKSPELKPGDTIAVEAVGLLKVVELSVFGPAVEGHIH